MEPGIFMAIDWRVRATGPFQRPALSETLTRKFGASYGVHFAQRARFRETDYAQVLAPRRGPECAQKAQLQRILDELRISRWDMVLLDLCGDGTTLGRQPFERNSCQQGDALKAFRGRETSVGGLPVRDRSATDTKMSRQFCLSESSAVASYAKSHGESHSLASPFQASFLKWKISVTKNAVQAGSCRQAMPSRSPYGLPLARCHSQVETPTNRPDGRPLTRKIRIAGP